MSDYEVIEGEVVPMTGTEVLLHEGERQHKAEVALNLFGTNDPVVVIEKATVVADALAAMIDKQGLYTNIQGKKHVRVEGWTVLGSMLGVFPVLDYCKPVTIDGVEGFEAAVFAQTLDGHVVGKAVAYCMRSERTWKSRETFAVSSMAQTRATAKALRIPLGFVMALAGYEVTPAEERDDASGTTAGKPSGGRPTGEAKEAASAAPTPEEMEELRLRVANGIAVLNGQPGWSEEEILATAQTMWGANIEALSDLDGEQLLAIIDGMNGHGKAGI